MNEVELGKAVYGRSGGTHGWFHIEDNKDNIYRVLPPMKSLAKEGKYAKFYVTHRGFRGSDNKQKPFLCVETSVWDNKTNTRSIKSHCPICDWVAAIEAQIVQYKSQGATDEQIREYRNKYVFPFQAERKYYINVINPEGKIGVLPIGSKMFKSLEAMAKEQEKAGFDVCGMNGLYVNFKKQTRFKGDRDAVHSAVLYMHPDGTGGYRPVGHQIDTAFAQRLGPEAADLGSLFRSIEIDQCAQLVALDGDARAKYVDELFPKEAVAPAAGAAPAAPAQNQQFMAPTQAAAPAAAPAAPLAAPTQQFGALPALGAPSAGSLPAPGAALAAPAAPAAAPAAPMSFTAPANALPGPAAPAVAPAAPAPMSFTPPANALPGPAQGPAQPGFGGFGQTQAGPVIPGTPTSSLDDKAFANFVRPLGK